jgi:hypothetical protein
VQLPSQYRHTDEVLAIAKICVNTWYGIDQHAHPRNPGDKPQGEKPNSQIGQHRNMFSHFNSPVQNPKLL